MENILEIRNLKTFFNVRKEGTKEYVSLKAVNDVSMDIPKSSTVCIVGESGCGKSVTALSVMGLAKHKEGAVMEGSISYYSEKGKTEIVGADEKTLIDIRRNEISMIFQEPMTSLNPVYTIGHQVLEAIRLYKQSATKEEALKLIDMVEIDDSSAVFDMYPHELSGGMRQRIMISLALASNPKLIIADEPTTALDVTIQKQILLLLDNLKKKTGCSILMITHDLGVVSEMADFIYVMYCGKIIEQGTCEQIIGNPVHPYTRDLFKCRPDVKKPRERLYNIKGNVPSPINLKDSCYFMDRCECTCDECEKGVPKLTEVYEGHLVRCCNFNAYVNVKLDKTVWDAPLDNAPVIEVKNLYKSYTSKKNIIGKKHKKEVLKNVSLKVKEGTTLGLVGESGCGKTTVGKCILKLAGDIDSGQILYRNEDIYKYDKEHLQNFRTKAQMIFQDPYSSLSPKMKVLDIIKEGVIEHGIVDEKDADEYCLKVMEECGLSRDVAGKLPKDFSGGQRQRICIARAVALKPEFIVCDEPVSALDVSIQAQIINLLRKIQKERGISLLFISHDLSVVKHISDEVCVIYNGEIVEYNTTREVFKNPRHPYTKKLVGSLLTL